MKTKCLLIFLSLIFFSCVHQKKSYWSPMDSAWMWNAKGHAARISTYDKTGANNDNIQIQSGQTVILADIKGAGIIRHIWMTTNGRGPIGRALILKMYWDGYPTPSVEVPFGDFFAVGNAMEADVNSYPITVVSRGRARNCWWQMPFSNGAKIEITNEGAEPHGAFYFYIDYLSLDEPPPTKERFYAQYRQAYPANFPENYLILDTKGKGHYVGTVMSIIGAKPQWWGEGDELIEVDNFEPIRGTGTEDYFCDAWGMRQHLTLWHGSPVAEGYDEAGKTTSMYRFHILDPIPFQKHIKVSIEHGTQNDRADYISSVAFWYQEPPASVFPKMPQLFERLYGEMKTNYIRQRAWQLAMDKSSKSNQDLKDLLGSADTEENKLLIEGLSMYCESIHNPNDEALKRIDEKLKSLKIIVESIKVEERLKQPEIDVPTDNDAPIPCPALLAYRILERARLNYARELSMKKGFGIGDELIVESRDFFGKITSPPTYQDSSDFTNSYAKVDDTRLMGEGARFTYGGAENSWARFTPAFPKSGKYEVFVIFSYGANADDTRYEIKCRDGVFVVPLKQRGRPNTENRNNDIWHSLGEYYFEEGQNIEKGSVTLHTSPGTSIPNIKFEYRAYADSVRFVFLGE